MEEYDHDLQMPIPPIQIAFIELHEMMQCAIRAGFTPDQGFELIRSLYEQQVMRHYAESLIGDDDDDS